MSCGPFTSNLIPLASRTSAPLRLLVPVVRTVPARASFDSALSLGLPRPRGVAKPPAALTLYSGQEDARYSTRIALITVRSGAVSNFLSSGFAPDVTSRFGCSLLPLLLMCSMMILR